MPTYGQESTARHTRARKAGIESSGFERYRRGTNARQGSAHTQRVGMRRRGLMLLDGYGTAGQHGAPVGLLVNARDVKPGGFTFGRHEPEPCRQGSAG